MKKSYNALIIVTLVIVLGGILVFAKQGSRQSEVQPEKTMAPALNIEQKQVIEPSAMAKDTANTPTAVSPTAEPTAVAQANGVFSDEGDIEGSGEVHLVIYDGKTFSPGSLTVKVGDIVVFKNSSSGLFQPASNPHPSHTDYAGFDAGQSISSGKSYQFLFTKIGTWGYHDHLHPLVKGVVVVTK